jgi:iron complex transport system ATP-binding protein
VNTAPALDLHEISFVREGRAILNRISLQVQSDQRWLVLGANGSGKTTLIRIAALYQHPSSGSVSVLGEELGRTDVRSLRSQIGYASAALAAQFRTDLISRDVVMTARHGALEPWWHRYDTADQDQAVICLRRMGVAHLADRSIGTLSSGEMQRVLLARTLMNSPAVVLLDEPSARLDLAGREQLVDALEELSVTPQAPPLVLVTHHVDEIPPSVTHTLLLRDGQSLAAGPIADTLTAESLSTCFGLKLRLERRPNGRFTAWSE